jgi:hypothetical protein
MSGKLQAGHTSRAAKLGTEAPDWYAALHELTLR